MKDSKEAIDYLKGRGFDGEAVKKLRFGFVGDPLESHRAMAGMVSIPFITPTGTVAIRFRRITGEGNKYHQETGSLSPLYNVREFHRPEPYIGIVEGEFDGGVLSALVGVPGVGLPGVGQWAKNGKIYRRLFQDYDKVFVIMDPDDPGQKTATQIVKSIPNAVNILLPFDLNDTFLAYGKDYILKELGLCQTKDLPLAA